MKKIFIIIFTLFLLNIFNKGELNIYAKEVLNEEVITNDVKDLPYMCRPASKTKNFADKTAYYIEDGHLSSDFNTIVYERQKGQNILEITVSTNGKSPNLNNEYFLLIFYDLKTGIKIKSIKYKDEELKETGPNTVQIDISDLPFASFSVNFSCGSEEYPFSGDIAVLSISLPENDFDYAMTPYQKVDDDFVYADIKQFITLHSEKDAIYNTNINDPISLEILKTYFKSTDNSNLTSDIVFETNYVASEVGIYYLKASVSDSYGNISILNCEINVQDLDAPIINTKNINDIDVDSLISIDDLKKYFEINDNYYEKSNIKVQYETNYKQEKKVGSYYIKCIAEDGSNNISSATIHFKVVDNKAPVITFNGKLSGGKYKINISENVTIENLKALFSVKDNYDTDLIVNLEGDLNFNIIGDHKVKCSVVDSSGNKAEYDLIVNVRDNIYPKLNCLVKYVLTDISKQMQLDEIKKLFTASDNYDTELVIDFESNYLPLTPGVYYILASVSDSSGNKVSLKIAIIVVDNEAPVINVSGGIEIIEHNNLQEEQVIEHLKKLVGDTYEIISLNFDFNELLQYKETNVSYKIKNKYTNEIQEITSVLRLTSTQNNDNYINFTLIFIIMSTSITTTVIIFIYYRKKKNKLTS